MRTWRHAWLVPLALCVLSSAATAQEENGQKREGFWIGFGLGGGWSTDATLDGSSSAGMGAYGRLGGTLSQHFLLGFEAMAWIDAQVSRSLARTNATLSAMFYPSSTAGFYLKGGLGVAYLQMATPIGTAQETGIGSTWGAGYDIRLGSNFSLTPSFGLLFQTFEAGGIQSTNTMTLFTVGLAWH